MTRIQGANNRRLAGGTQSVKHNLCGCSTGKHKRQWQLRSLVESNSCSLLQVPHQRQADYNYARDDAVNNENL
jgi:hypothetical protein